MTISLNKVVSVNYHLTVAGENGGEEITIEKPQQKILLSLFLAEDNSFPNSKNLTEKLVGDKFDFRVSAANGYGEFQLDHIVNLPIENFIGEDGKLDTETIGVGKNVPMSDAEGNRLWGKVIEVSLTNIKMDFNHPLAGKELHFNGEVLAIREASKEELEHGHVHGPGGHHH